METKFYCVIVLIAVIVISAVGVLATNPSLLQLSTGTTGPAYAGTVVNDNSVGQVAWSNPSGAVGFSLSNFSPAQTGGLNSGQASYYLKATGFSFQPAIPSSATITDITVEVSKGNGGPNGPSEVDYSAKIVKNNIPQGSDLADRTTLWNGALGQQWSKYDGGLWSLSWAVSDVNSPNFGFAISATSPGNVYNKAVVSSFRITVTYTYSPQPSAAYTPITVDSKAQGQSIGSAPGLAPSVSVSLTHSANVVILIGVTNMVSFNVPSASYKVTSLTVGTNNAQKISASGSACGLATGANQYGGYGYCDAEVWIYYSSSAGADTIAATAPRGTLTLVAVAFTGTVSTAPYYESASWGCPFGGDTGGLPITGGCSATPTQNILTGAIVGTPYVSVPAGTAGRLVVEYIAASTWEPAIPSAAYPASNTCAAALGQSQTEISCYCYGEMNYQNDPTGQAVVMSGGKFLDTTSGTTYGEGTNGASLPTRAAIAIALLAQPLGYYTLVSTNTVTNTYTSPTTITTTVTTTGPNNQVTTLTTIETLTQTVQTEAPSWGYAIAIIIIALLAVVIAIIWYKRKT